MSEQKTSKTRQHIFLAFLLLAVPCFILLFGKMKHTFSSLPYYYPEDVVQIEKNGKMVNDTIWHTIPEFNLINQDSVAIDRRLLDGHISVVDFFFTTCTTICPKMTRQTKTLAWMLEGEYFKDVRYLSISVDPEFDVPLVLRDYQKKMESAHPQWTMATGNKEEIYDLGVNGFKLTTQEDLAAVGGFLHSEKFVLVDKDGHIRGYYDGTSPDEVRDLAEDIKMLIGEERKGLKE
jgi:protein SCO1/2